jgi:hypothetical protein
LENDQLRADKDAENEEIGKLHKELAETQQTLDRVRHEDNEQIGELRNALHDLQLEMLRSEEIHNVKVGELTRELEAAHKEAHYHQTHGNGKDEYGEVMVQLQETQNELLHARRTLAMYLPVEGSEGGSPLAQKHL